MTFLPRIKTDEFVPLFTQMRGCLVAHCCRSAFALCSCVARPLNPAMAQANRTVMQTDMNDESSRSHSIVQVKTVCKHFKDLLSIVRLDLVEDGSEVCR